MLTAEQHDYLLQPLRSARIASRRQGGKNLSYLEAWDIKAHLSRVFGFCNWDLEMLQYHHAATRDYTAPPKEGQAEGNPMVEVIYSAQMQLTVRDHEGLTLAVYSEGAVGSTSGPANMLGEHHDNALKTAASDATKRCAINLGTQFGLSLYDDGNKNDVVRRTLVRPEGATMGGPPVVSEEAQAALEHSLGATPVTEGAAS